MKNKFEIGDYVVVCNEPDVHIEKSVLWIELVRRRLWKTGKILDIDSNPYHEAVRYFVKFADGRKLWIEGEFLMPRMRKDKAADAALKEYINWW